MPAGSVELYELLHHRTVNRVLPLTLTLEVAVASLSEVIFQ